jgi:putative spermidine/putrescine transport system permease protein
VTYLITSPIIIPHIFIALGVFILAIRLGLSDNELTLAGAHATIAMPFVVLITGSSLRQIDPTIEKAARVLGAGPTRAFFAATFPSLLPAIVASAVFSFFVSFDELIIAQFLMSSQETLPMRIWADLKLDVSPTVAAVSSVLIVATTVAMVGAELLRRRAAGVRGD